MNRIIACGIGGFIPMASTAQKKSRLAKLDYIHNSPVREGWSARRRMAVVKLEVLLPKGYFAVANGPGGMKKADASRFARTQTLQGKRLRQPAGEFPGNLQPEFLAPAAI